MHRPLTKAESTDVEDQLERLRDHYECWPTERGNEWRLSRFAYYEGCDRTPACAEILAIASPLALGRELVERHGCEWCMIETDDGARIGVAHHSLEMPIDLYGLDSSPLLDPDEHDEDLEPFARGEGAVESLFAIVRKLQDVG